MNRCKVLMHVPPLTEERRRDLAKMAKACFDCSPKLNVPFKLQLITSDFSIFGHAQDFGHIFVVHGVLFECSNPKYDG